MTTDHTDDPAGRLYVVATPIGNLGDITRRAAEILAAVDLVVAEDTRRTRALLSHLGIRARLESHHEHNERRRLDAVLRALSAGQDVALVSDAGTPALSDPGYPLVRAAIEAGITVVPVPGASAVLAALVASGLPTDRFTFVGYPPRRAAARRRFFTELIDAPGTLVVLESPRRLAATLVAAAEVLGGARLAVIGRELTKAHEEHLRGTLASLSEDVVEPPRGEVTLCIDRAPADAPEDSDATALGRDYAALLDAGRERTAALREVARRHGLRRRDVYRALHLEHPPTVPGDPDV